MSRVNLSGQLILLTFSVILGPSHLAPVIYHHEGLSLPDVSNFSLSSSSSSSSWSHVQTRLVPLNTTTHQLIPLDSTSLASSSSYFTVLGIHAFERNISLCQSDNAQSNLLTGSSFGFALTKHSNQSFLCLYNPNSVRVNALIVRNAYSNLYPIPGGCNIEFPLEIAPYLQTRITDLLLVSYLEFQRAAMGNETNVKRMCSTKTETRRLSYEVYAYLGPSAKGEEEEDYFHRLAMMSNRDWLIKHGILAHRIDHTTPYFRLYFSTNLGHSIYFNIHVRDNRTGAGSLYVPIRTTSHLRITNYAPLLIILVTLAIASTVVSVVGHRHFILEVYYFSSLLIFGLCLLLLLSKMHTPITSLMLIYATLLSLALAALWTALVRWSRNLKLALSLHSLVLSFWLIALSFDLYQLILPIWHPVMEAHFNIYLSVATLAVHCALFFFFDLFWLSALSTSIITVYLLLLPFDLFLGSATLFRIIFNVWLYNRHFVHPVANIISLTKQDLVTFILFTFVVLISITWQLWSKIGNLAYGFSCITSGASSSSSSPTKLPSSSSSSRVRMKKKNKNKKNRRGKRSRKNSSTRPKRYRCKYCHKVSTSKSTSPKRNRSHRRSQVAPKPENPHLHEHQDQYEAIDHQLVII